jgi:hypothetical protein
VLLFLGLAFAPCIQGNNQVSFLNLSTKMRELEDRIDKSEVDDCGCLSENINDQGLESLRLWHFPILCTILYLLFGTFVILWAFTHETIFGNLWASIKALGEDLGCWWAPESNFVPLKGEHNILQSTYVEALIDRTQNEIASDSDCGCDSDNLDEKGLGSLRLWHFPVICTLLLPLYFIVALLSGIITTRFFDQLYFRIGLIAEKLGCWWD